MKRILVPTDFSKHAEYALKVAAQIAKKNDGEIFLVHMLELPTSGNDAISTAHEIPELMLFKNAAINKLDSLMESDFLNGVKISKIIQFEMAFDGIVKYAKSHDIDLIVMGSHGASGFQEMFIGSNTEKVAVSKAIAADVPELLRGRYGLGHATVLRILMAGAGLAKEPE